MSKAALALIFVTLAPCLAAGQLGTGLASAQSRMPVVALLHMGSPVDLGPRHFVEGLHALGYKDGEALVIETRYAHGDMTRFPRLAHELIERSPTVIVAPCGSQPALDSRH